MNYFVICDVNQGDQLVKCLVSFPERSLKIAFYEEGTLDVLLFMSEVSCLKRKGNVIKIYYGSITKEKQPENEKGSANLWILHFPSSSDCDTFKNRLMGLLEEVGGGDSSFSESSDLEEIDTSAASTSRIETTDRANDSKTARLATSAGTRKFEQSLDENLKRGDINSRSVTSTEATLDVIRISDVEEVKKSLDCFVTKDCYVFSNLQPQLCCQDEQDRRSYFHASYMKSDTIYRNVVVPLGVSSPSKLLSDLGKDFEFTKKYNNIESWIQNEVERPYVSWLASVTVLPIIYFLISVGCIIGSIILVSRNIATLAIPVIAFINLFLWCSCCCFLIVQSYHVILFRKRIYEDFKKLGFLDKGKKKVYGRVYSARGVNWETPSSGGDSISCDSSD